MTYLQIQRTGENSLRKFGAKIQSILDSSNGSNAYGFWNFYDSIGVSDSVARTIFDGAVSTAGGRIRVGIIKMLVTAYRATGGDFWVKTTQSRPEIPEGGGIAEFSGGWVRWSPNSITGGVRIGLAEGWFTEHEGTPPVENDRTDIVVTPLTGWAEGYVNVRPSDELLARYPASIRPMATRSMVANTGGNATTVNFIDGEFVQTSSSGSGYPRGTELLEQARAAYREALRLRLGRPFAAEEEAFKQRREEHRAKTKANFEAFVRDRAKDTEHHIGKLPFVPHGLASSRRWGIEVESGGARGVATPANGWEAKGDGSLRSAYDGYVEVQDFEPFDEEVVENIHWENCVNAGRHNPRVEFNDTERGWIYIANPDYLDPRECQGCGNVTRIVHREPQTIRHHSRSGDCKEFVSPILTSMHSKGLEELTTALSKNPQNSSAGVHVHVEANDLTPQQIAIMVYGYDILEPILEASYRRERRDFCERRNAEDVLAAARAARGEGYQNNSGRRYSTLNTHSMSAHGTLEFRAMGPVYEYDYLVRWAMLCRDLVNSVAAGAQTKDFAKIKSWDDLTVFLAKFGKEYMRAAVYEMSGETGEAAKLEKAGEPVTTAALNADLNTLTEALAAGSFTVSEAMEGLQRSVQRAFPSFDEIRSRIDHFATADANLIAA